MTNQATNRPWSITRHSNPDCSCRYLSFEGREICTFYNDVEENMANAKLIVKSVNCHDELVRVLKEAHLSMTRCECRQEIKRHSNILYEIEQALSKAE